MRRIIARTHNHKIVVHHVAPINAVPVSDKLVLGWTIMHEDSVSETTPPKRECFACTNGGNVNF